MVLAGCGGGATAKPQAPAGSGRPHVVLDAAVDGRSLSEWDVDWWRWRLALPRAGAARSRRSCITSGQRGPVWFLGHDYSIRPVDESSLIECPVPRGYYLLVATPAIDCSTIEGAPFHAATQAGLGQCALADWSQASPRRRLSLDGHALVPFGVFLETPPFTFRAPPRDSVFMLPGRTSGRAAVAGDVTMIGPLPTGQHVLAAEQQYRGLRPEHVTYELSVR
jgi:hypothetical protein